MKALKFFDSKYLSQNGKQTKEEFALSQEDLTLENISVDHAVHIDYFFLLVGNMKPTKEEQDNDIEPEQLLFLMKDNKVKQ